jgi:glycosyltransferase involved in cell wall biosynthesis
MSSATPKILFVHNLLTRFVELDLECLRKSYQVTECYLSSRRVNPLSVWRQVRSHDMVFGWFASWHTFLPLLFARLLDKPSLLVIGGYDLANQPDIGYGHQRGGIKKWLSRLVMRLATCLVTNARYSQREAELNAAIPGERVGVIYHGLPDPFGELPDECRAPMALTVGNVCRENLFRKGHEPFVRAAALLPEVEFVLAGAWRDDAVERLRAIATPNVTFTGWVDDATLLDYYRRASVYVQASTHEGFGMSLAEAMLAGCLPLVTRVGAMPEVVSDCGIYITPHESAIARAIQESIGLPDLHRARARMRVLDQFPLEKRQRAFEQLIDRMLNRAQSREDSRLPAQNSYV